MGLKNKQFDSRERPSLSKYQIECGISQLKKFSLMKQKRIDNSNYLKKGLENLKNISFLEYDETVDWNHQYFIIKIDNDYNDFNKKLFNLGIHAMEENVWNCLEYNYDIINKNDNSDHNTPGYSSLKSTDNDSISFRFPYENNMRIYFHMMTPILIHFHQLSKHILV